MNLLLKYISESEPAHLRTVGSLRQIKHEDGKQSSALIGAAVKAFTPFEATKEYIEDSYRKLVKAEPISHS